VVTITATLVGRSPILRKSMIASLPLTICFPCRRSVSGTPTPIMPILRPMCWESVWHTYANCGGGLFFNNVGLAGSVHTHGAGVCIGVSMSATHKSKDSLGVG